ncbi:hypothetical protein HNV12_01530 [Methanococcoides sp. SA1]|nr:hypothetical protein [Methanococcoides sp. SA1]
MKTTSTLIVAIIAIMLAVVFTTPAFAGETKTNPEKPIFEYEGPLAPNAFENWNPVGEPWVCSNRHLHQIKENPNKNAEPTEVDMAFVLFKTPEGFRPGLFSYSFEINGIKYLLEFNGKTGVYEQILPKKPNPPTNV